MKNSLLAIALVTAGLAAAPLTSHAADDHSGFFINGNIGNANLDKGVFDDDDTAFFGNVGYRWAVGPSVLLGIEGGYADLGKFDAKSGTLGDTSAELKGWNLGANGHFNMTDNWYVSGRAGWFRGDRTIKGTFEGPYSIDDTKDGWYAGAGFGYDFNTNVSVGLNYDYYKVDKNNLDLSPSVVSVSAEYRF
jgi:opacity protein-like surface antigen